MKMSSYDVSPETAVNLLQFVNCGSNAAWSRYQQMYLLHVGLSVKQIGIIAPFQTIMKSIGYPFWSYLVDLTNNFKLIYTISTTLSITMLSMLFMDITKKWIFDPKYFILFGIIRCLRSFCNASWVLIDAVTLQLIKDSHTYGEHRLYAAIAWGVCSLTVGYIIDYFGYMSILIYQFTGFIILTYIVNAFIPNTSQMQNNNNKEINDDNNLHERNNDYYTLLKHRIIAIRNDTNFMICLIIISIYYIGYSIVDQIIFIQLKQEFSVNQRYIGSLAFIQTILEFPIFYGGKYILKHFNPNKIILFSHIILIIRIYSHSLIKTENHLQYIYGLQLLHSFCFALPNITLRAYFHKKATTYSSINLNISSSIQSILGTIFIFSHGIGVFIWSQIYSKYSALHVYYFGCLALLPSILYISMNLNNNASIFNDSCKSNKTISINI